MTGGPRRLSWDEPAPADLFDHLSPSPEGTPNMTDETPAPALFGDAALAVIRAMNNTPYAADTRVRIPTTYRVDGVPWIHADEIVGFLEGLAHVLRDAGDRNAGNERALLALRSDVAAFRRILGTDPA